MMMPSRPTGARPREQLIGDGGDEIVAGIHGRLGHDAAGFAAAGQCAGLQGGGERVVAEDDVGGVLRLEGLGAVDVFGADDDGEIAGLEHSRQRKHEQRLHPHVEPGAAGVKVKHQGLRT